MHRHSLHLLFCLLLLAVGCAKMVTPVGGPKDVTPPAVVKEAPANGTVNFKGNTFKVTFNEYVTLNNTLENVLISPPPATVPTYTLSGKTLIVKFQDTLLPDQTYNVGFADCIQDFTEGNPIPFYNYAFSTGSSVDSMMIEGKVVDAQTMQPVKNCFVFAYSENVDSLPMTTRPQFISKTQGNGTFQIKNIKPGNYKIFALQDGDNNLIYNLPSESIAFGDELWPAVLPPKTDTATADSTKTTTPEAQTDSARTQRVIRLFQARAEQKVQKSQNKELGKYEFIFSENIDNLTLNTIQGDIDYFTHIGNDTLILYTKNTLTDTVMLTCSVADNIIDTLQLTPYKAKDTRAGRRGKEDKADFLSVNVTNKGELHAPLTLTFAYPIRPVTDVKVRFVAKHKRVDNDTSYVSVSVPDSMVMSLAVPFKYEEKVPYEIMIPDSAFVGYNGLCNDTIEASFVAHTEKDYGSLRMTYTLPDGGKTYVATLMKDGGAEIRNDRLTQSGEILYEHLAAGKYKVKLLEDANDNGKWDTGDYKEKKQPERVAFFSKSVNIRGFWELEETFEWPTE